jgi:hypothetical protein
MMACPLDGNDAILTLVGRTTSIITLERRPGSYLQPPVLSALHYLKDEKYEPRKPYLQCMYLLNHKYQDHLMVRFSFDVAEFSQNVLRLITGKHHYGTQGLLSPDFGQMYLVHFQIS